MPIELNPAAAAAGGASSAAPAAIRLPFCAQATTPSVPTSLPGAAPAIDTALWDRLIRRYGRCLTGVARRAFHGAGSPSLCQEAEDLVQDVWCRLYQRLGPRLTLRRNLGEAGLYAYLVRTTRNLAVDRAREHRAQKRGGVWQRRYPAGRRRLGRAPTHHPDPVRDLVSHGPSPEETAIRRQGRDLFRQRCLPYTSLDQPRRDLAILELALMDGWSSRQIVSALRDPISPSAVDTLIHRVRRGLAAEGLRLPSRR